MRDKKYDINCLNRDKLHEFQLIIWDIPNIKSAINLSKYVIYHAITFKNIFKNI